MDQMRMNADQQAMKEGLTASDFARFNDPDRAKLTAYTASRVSGNSLRDSLYTALDQEGGKGFGLVGPGDGWLTSVLDTTLGWIPSVRLHGIVHDAHGFAYNTWGLGGGYTYTGVDLLPSSSPQAGQVGGMARQMFMKPMTIDDIPAAMPR
jgi:hypothetical protein